MTNEPARERDIVERLADAADENLHLVWYRGHPLPLIGAPDGVHFILRGSPYGDTFALANEVNFALPFTRLREQLDWPNDATFQLGDLVQKKGRASWRGRVVGWYRTDLTALGFAVESDFEPGSVQIYPQTALEPREQLEVPVSDGWRDIESAPKDGTRILIAGGTRQHPDSMGGPEPISQPYIAHWDDLWKQWEGNPVSHSDCYSHEPTHWRPLPEPPAMHAARDTGK